MKAELVNPFLESAKNVIEQMIMIRPETGELQVKNVKLVQGHIWIQIGMSGQLSGDVMFGLSESVALKIISAMMGGFVITEIDEMGKSAISELGNMISGNASTLLSNQGVHVDITPPRVLSSGPDGEMEARALTIPLIIDGIGELDIQVLIA
ncbi:chemotaxis protein CheX [Paenibacillus sp. SYP-B4298]|uniref:chemotaxis protein CheX n=1 Tax=Paenibacillus sp. SYP-B4298 TaxID=2996034 RepID=UPI0022DDB556|nr:chemotaxis protein CheX [Paenibacillus sp. SYP-B4298]